MAFQSALTKAFLTPLFVFFFVNKIVVAQETTKIGIQSLRTGGNPVVCNALSSEINQRAHEINERRKNLYLLEASKKGCFTVAASLLQKGSSLNA